MKEQAKKSLGAGTLVLVGVMFYLSGAAALVYEIVWTRLFSMAAGGNTRSLTAVLAAYMGGLALGSWLGGRLVDRRTSRPVLVYGALEGLVGLTALVLTLAIPALVPVLKLGRAAVGGGLAFDLLRFVVCALFLAIPTTLMGATFPVLLRGVLANREKFGQAAGVLYGANTLGAMSGSLVAGFVLIPTFGFLRTVGAAVATNLLILAVVFVLPGLRRLTAPAREVESPAPEPGTGLQRWVLYIGYGLSGLAAMVYQVGWARTLSLVMGNSTYSLSVIFAAYIGGLALGGFLISPWVDRRRMAFGWAAGLELAIGLLALLVMPFFEQLTVWMFGWTIDYQDRFNAFQAFRFAAAFLLIIGPTAAMGALLPVVVRIAGRQSGGVGEPAGRVYAANTVGAIAGSVLATHVLIRFLGVQDALLAATGVTLTIGIVWLWFSAGGRRSRAVGGAAAAAAVAAMVLIPRWDPIIMNSGPYIYANLQKDEIQAAHDVRAFIHNFDRVLFTREGVEATVSVFESRIYGWRYLRINGKTDASDSADMPTQVLSAQLPMLLHPDPQTVLVVGLASGVSSGSALTHAVRQVRCIEISPEVLEASHLFEHVSHLDYDNPRFQVIIDDARSYLTLNSDHYDVILTEPSNPWIAGMGSLFTREYFTLMRDHLNPGGLAASWIGVYDMDPEIVRMMMRTFSEVFPYTTMWEAVPGTDYLMVGSTQPVRVSPKELDRRAAITTVSRDLKRIDIDRGRDLLARFMMGNEEVRAVAGKGPVVVDDRLQLEYLMPRAMSRPRQHRMLELYAAVLSHHEPALPILDKVSPEDRELLGRFDATRTMFYRAFFAMFDEMSGSPDAQFVPQLWEQVLSLCGDRFPKSFAEKDYAISLSERGDALMNQGKVEQALKDLTASFKLDPENVVASHRLISYYQDQGDFDTAVAWARISLRARPGDPLANTVMAFRAQKEGDLEQAEKYLLAAVDGMPEFPDYRINYGLFLAQRGRFGEAEIQLRKALDLNPGSDQARQLLARVLKDQGKVKESEKILQQAP